MGEFVGFESTDNPWAAPEYEQYPQMIRDLVSRMTNHESGHMLASRSIRHKNERCLTTCFNGVARHLGVLMLWAPKRRMSRKKASQKGSGPGQLLHGHPARPILSIIPLTDFCRSIAKKWAQSSRISGQAHAPAPHLLDLWDLPLTGSTGRLPRRPIARGLRKVVHQLLESEQHAVRYAALVGCHAIRRCDRHDGSSGIHSGETGSSAH